MEHVLSRSTRFSSAWYSVLWRMGLRSSCSDSELKLAPLLLAPPGSPGAQCECLIPPASVLFWAMGSGPPCGHMGSWMLVLGLSGRKLTFSGIPNAKDQRVEPRRPLPEGPAAGGAPCGWRCQPGGPEPCPEGGILTLPLAFPSDLGGGCSVAGASLNWFLLFMGQSAGGYSAIGQQ